MNPLDRRQFLKAALLASGALTATSLGTARAQALKGTRVLVVGAGISGLGAARSLVNQGADVVVLEAKPHIGGRLHTDYSLGAPFEVGAGWIHGPSGQNPVKQLADAVGAKTVVTEDDDLIVFDADGEEIDAARLTKINGDWRRVLDQIDDELELEDGRSLRGAIADLAPWALDDPGVVWALSAYTEFAKGASIETLSAVYHDDDAAFPSADVVVTSGYDKILSPIAAGLDIRLSTAVTGIGYGDDGVTVTTGGGTLTADYVVCSVPLGVLKAETIAFDPPLPRAYRDNIRGLGFGSVTKIAFKFQTPFWDTETQYFGVMTEEKGRWNYWLNYRTFSPENILLGLSVGAYAPVADRMTDAAMAADALDVLRDVWGDAVGTPVQALTTHWSTDPETRGAYSFPMPGGTPSQFDELAAPVAERLFLCGEHTVFDYAGTTHGAYLSGLRAAEQIIEAAR
ncbi:MAG: FAD-dependent oxidoreductase [Alphaproteobacteria bacterium]|nr:FAD-dependent oxidoreductase [Alphaproteobacteria bacterium]